jgi:AhpD family alkylhydroperoxidase
MVDVCCDPQTSGGLLIAVAEGRAEELVRQLHEAGVETAARIGRAVGEGTGRVRIVTKRDGKQGATMTGKETWGQGDKENDNDREQQAVTSTEVSRTGVGGMGQQEEACCAAGHGATAGGAAAGSVREKFQEFLRAANAPGALDAPTKQAIAIALSVLTQCEPCTKAHIAKARKMGFTQAEIDEVAWMAIAFGGSPTMMFVNGIVNG